MRFVITAERDVVMNKKPQDTGARIKNKWLKSLLYDIRLQLKLFETFFHVRSEVSQWGF